MEVSITFENLPQAVMALTREVNEMKSLIMDNKEQPPTPPEELLNIEEAAEFLHLTVPTLYSKVSKGELPVMKRGKRLYFSRTELLEYIQHGRKKSNAEIEQEAAAYVKNKKGAE